MDQLFYHRLLFSQTKYLAWSGAACQSDYPKYHWVIPQNNVMHSAANKLYYLLPVSERMKWKSSWLQSIILKITHLSKVGVWGKHSRSHGENLADDYSILPSKEEVCAQGINYLLHENGFKIKHSNLDPIPRSFFFFSSRKAPWMNHCMLQWTTWDAKTCFGKLA